MNNIAFIGKSNEEIIKNIIYIFNEKKLDTKNTLYIKKQNSKITFKNAICCKDYDSLDISKYGIFLFELDDDIQNIESISNILKDLLLSKEQKIIITASSVKILEDLNLNFEFFRDMDKGKTIKAYQLI